MLIYSLIKAILGYIIFMFIGTNLIGFIVRQIFTSGLTKNFENLAVVIRQDLRATDILISVLFSILTIGYLLALIYYFNVGVAISAAILMFTRLPDLLYEIKMGQKITLQNMPKTFLDISLSLLSWLAFPLLWYSLYHVQNPNSFF